MATRLSSADIIMGKYAARMIAFVGTVAAGLPIMLLLHRLGGIDGWLILLAYTGILSTGFFLSAMSIWVSTLARDSRRAIGYAMLLTCLWLWVPFAVAFILPRFGVRLPGWILSVNAWVLNSGPLGLLLRFPGMSASAALLDLVLRMCGMQLLGGICCLLGAIVQLRRPAAPWQEGSRATIRACSFAGGLAPARLLATIRSSGKRCTRVVPGGWLGWEISLSTAQSRPRSPIRPGSSAGWRPGRSGNTAMPRARPAPIAPNSISSCDSSPRRTTPRWIRLGWSSISSCGR